MHRIVIIVKVAKTLDLFFPHVLGLHPKHMGISRLGVELEPQLLAYTIGTATLHP